MLTKLRRKATRAEGKTRWRNCPTSPHMIYRVALSKSIFFMRAPLGDYMRPGLHLKDGIALPSLSIFAFDKINGRHRRFRDGVRREGYSRAISRNHAGHIKSAHDCTS